MTFAELIKELSDNLSDDQKKLTASMMIDGNTYEVNSILISVAGSGLDEGQPLLANFSEPE